MTPAAPIIGDLFLSLCAILGLLTLQRVLADRDPWEPLTRRFIFGIRVMLLLFAGRALIVVTGAELFRIAVLLAAALVPLAVLLLCEGLLRRHAPLWAKLWVGFGTILFAVLAFWLPGSLDPIRLIPLLVFQMSGFAIGGYLVVRRYRKTLSRPENQLVERLALSLFLLVPLAMADFLIVLLGLPVQVSPLGVLFLCWLAVTLGPGGHGNVIGSFAAILLGAVGSGLVLSLMAGFDRDGAILAVAVILSAVLTTMIFVAARTARAEAQSAGLLQFMAGIDLWGDLSPERIVERLMAHPAIEGAVRIAPEHLRDLDMAVLDNLFRIAPVLNRADLPMIDGAEADHMAHLFDRFDASHILLTQAEPIRLLALSMPSLSVAPRAELEIAVLQRMCLLASGAKK